jgi:hypothetical protein
MCTIILNTHWKHLILAFFFICPSCLLLTGYLTNSVCNLNNSNGQMELYHSFKAMKVYCISEKEKDPNFTTKL